MKSQNPGIMLNLISFPSPFRTNKHTSSHSLIIIFLSAVGCQDDTSDHATSSFFLFSFSFCFLLSLKYFYLFYPYPLWHQQSREHVCCQQGCWHVNNTCLGFFNMSNIDPKSLCQQRQSIFDKSKQHSYTIIM